ncbi:MAG: SUMF1/EgtB/PvdO family nonheme iron enzyme [Pirellulaceae bacterium]|nr:SUMF1/EgtB/PvdO family nonheme iron enzyme [Pirellulaceae bacterium]
MQPPRFFLYHCPVRPACYPHYGSWTIMRFLWAMRALLLGLALMPTIATAQQKHALLVAVGEYQRPDKLRTLKYPEADALAIKQALERADGTGYEVTLLLGRDATGPEVLKALREIAKKEGVGGHLILGFFGHGVQYGPDAYFCPFDTNVRQVVNADGQKLYDGNKPLLEPSPETMVPMREMLAAMALSDAKHKLLLADCCREDPNRARGGVVGRAFGSDLKLEDLPRNSAAMFACSEGEQAYELDDFGHGAFTAAFLKAFKSSENPTANELSVSVYRGVQSLVQPKGVKQTVNSLFSGGVIDLGMVNRVAAVKRPAPEMRSSAQSPTLKEPTTEISTVRNQVDMQLVPISPGTFWMGSANDQEGRFSDEVRHVVTISRAFHISTTEVTQAQYQAVMQNNPSIVRQPQHPVDSVSWNDAVRFCEALSALPAEKAAGRVYRLPTEAEWEYACRAGQESRFHFGDDAQQLVQYAWFKANAAGSQSLPVKQKQPNAWGIYDMHGNVYEWCADWYEAKISPSPATDPTGPTSGSERVMRGGSFREDAKYLRSAARMSYPPQSSFPFVGFRVVMEQQ